MLCDECRNSPALYRYRDGSGKTLLLCPECAKRIESTSSVSLIREGPARDIDYLAATA